MTELGNAVIETSAVTGDACTLDVLLKVLCASLDELRAGFVASSPDGKVLYANRAALGMMALGWPIRARNGYLRGEDRKQTALLLEGLLRVTAEASPSQTQRRAPDICLAYRSSTARASIATLRPLSLAAQASGRGQSAVAIFITRIGEDGLGVLYGIADCFGLTPAETRTLEQIAKGRSVAETAAILDISKNTVKTFLQKIFAKTGLSRQAQLVTLVKDLQAPLGCPSTAMGTLSRTNGARLCNPVSAERLALPF